MDSSGGNDGLATQTKSHQQGVMPLWNRIPWHQEMTLCCVLWLISWYPVATSICGGARPEKERGINGVRIRRNLRHNASTREIIPRDHCTVYNIQYIHLCIWAVAPMEMKPRWHPVSNTQARPCPGKGRTYVEHFKVKNTSGHVPLISEIAVNKAKSSN